MLQINQEILDQQEIMDEWFPLKRKQEKKGEVQLRVQYADKGIIILGIDCWYWLFTAARPAATRQPATNTTTNNTPTTTPNKRNSISMDVDTPASSSTPSAPTTATSPPPAITTTPASPSTSASPSTIDDSELKKSASWEAPETKEVWFYDYPCYQVLNQYRTCWSDHTWLLRTNGWKLQTIMTILILPLPLLYAEENCELVSSQAQSQGKLMSFS